MKDRIYQLMKQQGMTQKEFAGELCIAEGTLSGIFTGRTRPSNAIVSAIHERFPEVSVPWLMFGEGDMHISESSFTAVTSQSIVGDTATLAGNGAKNDVPDLFTGIQNVTPQQPIIRETVKYLDKPQRRITEIRVFYDDGTFETFSPGK